MPDWKEAIRNRLAPAGLDVASEVEMVEEFAQHMEDRYRELQASGTPEKECYRIVLEELGDPDVLVRAARFARRSAAPTRTLGTSARGRGGLVTGFAHDLKIAFRNLRTKPLFSLMVIGMLALGIAGNAAIFTIFNGLFLHSLPFAQSDRLIDIDETAPKWNLEHAGVNAPDLDEWRRSNSTFESMAFYRGPSYNLSVDGTSQRVTGAQVTREMLDVLELKPMMGRNFSPDEDRPGGAKVALLSYGLWQRVFRGDPNPLGKMLKLDDESYTIIGILPREAIFPDRTELWTPLQPNPSQNTGYYVNGVGRLKRGVSLDQARADLLRVHKAMVPQHKINETTLPILTPLRDRFLGDFKTVSRVLMGAVAVILLIACVNIAALMMVRGSFRSREIAIRIAVGASRRRIVAQLLTENMVLAAAGGIVGVLLGALCLRAMVSMMSENLPQWINFSLDWRFALFCVAITSAAALLFGLIPIHQALGVDVRGSLQDKVGRTTPSRGRRNALGTLMVCEIGLALLLSISAGLLVQAFRKVLHVDPGFRPENAVAFKVSIPDKAYSKPEQKIGYYDDLLTRLRAMPGVKAAGATSAPPLGGHWGGIFEAEGAREVGRQDETPEVLQVAATPGYFDAIGMTLLAGRTFEPQDGRPGTPTVVLVNETFAKHFWGKENPVGKRIQRLGRDERYQVVGLLRDEKHDGPDQAVQPSVFLPYAVAVAKTDTGDARGLQQMTIILRSSNDPKMLVEMARENVGQVDPEVPMYGVETMSEAMDRFLWARRAYSWLFGAFAAVALLLAAAGVYGMVSYTVSQRTQEIGIRMALGAQPRQVLAAVLREGMAQVAIGVAVGLVGALWAAKLLRTLLFDVSSFDPAIYAATVFGVLGVGLLANFAPARRAARVDPMRVLHSE